MLARLMHGTSSAMAEALLLTGVLGGFLAMLAAALWIIAAATGGPDGDEEPDDRTDIPL